MANKTNSKKIAHQARTWLGTPFHHQGRVKNVGSDCIGLILGVTQELGMTSTCGVPFMAFDVQGYSMEPNGKKLQFTLDKHLDCIPFEEIAVGDVLLFNVVKEPQHVGIVTNHPTEGLGLIHAYSPAGKVVEHGLTEKWKRRIIGAYRFNNACFGK